MGPRNHSGFVKSNVCRSELRSSARPGGSHVIIPTELTRYRNKYMRAVQNWYTRDHRAGRPPDLLDPHNVHGKAKLSCLRRGRVRVIGGEGN